VKIIGTGFGRILSDRFSIGKNAGSGSESSTELKEEQPGTGGSGDADRNPASTIHDTQSQSLNRLEQASRLQDAQGPSANRQNQPFSLNLPPAASPAPFNSAPQQTILNSRAAIKGNLAAAGALGIGAVAMGGAFSGAVAGAAIGACVGSAGVMGIGGLGAGLAMKGGLKSAMNQSSKSGSHPMTEDEARAEVNDIARHLDDEGASRIEDREDHVLIDGLKLDKK